MGQYYKIVNMDKREYLDPYDFGDGVKFMEFAMSSCGVLTALAILLCDYGSGGGGDLRSTEPVVGSWAGDRVIIVGDYSDSGLYQLADQQADPEGMLGRCYKNVAEAVKEAMRSDKELAEEMRNSR